MNEAARSEINHLDLRSRVTLNQDILWLQVTMDQLEVVDVRKCSQNLLGDDFSKSRYFVQATSIALKIDHARGRNHRKKKTALSKI